MIDASKRLPLQLAETTSDTTCMETRASLHLAAKLKLSFRFSPLHPFRDPIGDPIGDPLGELIQTKKEKNGVLESGRGLNG